MPKKKTIEEAQKLFSDNGWILLSMIYIDSKEPMAAICPKGHTVTKCYNSMRSGKTACRLCSGHPTYTIEDIRIALEKEGYKLISDKYIDNKTKLESICPDGHEWDFAWSDFNTSGVRCGTCFGTHKKTIKEVKEVFEKEGYRLITKDYERYQQKLDTLCPNGHSYSVSLSAFEWAGTRCPDCSNIPSYTIDDVKKIFISEGFTLLSEQYKNNGIKLDVSCQFGHIFHPRLRDFLYNKSRCPDCNGNRKWTISEIEEELSKEEYVLVIKEYQDIGSYIKVKCKNDHIWDITWSNYYHKKSRCPDCQGINSYTLEDVRLIFKKEGYKLLADNYHSCMVKLSTICPNGHPYGVRLNDFISKNSRCTRCRLLINESKCREIFEKLFGLEFIKCRPDFLFKSETNRILELDGFNEEYRLAFEYDGEFHYNPVYGEKTLAKIRKNDTLKDELCKKEGVILIRIPYTVKNKEKYIKEELTKRGIRWVCQ